MATGKSFTDSLNKGSDAYLKFPCCPCKTTEAVYKCVECQELYCQKCWDGHKSFVKDHTVVDVNPKDKCHHLVQSSGYSCEEHQGRIYEMYCAKHDAIFCAVCILKHKNCNGVDHIPDIASSLLLQQNQEKIKSGLVNLHTELQDIKFKLSEYLKEVNGNLDNILDAINEFKNKLLKRIEEIAKSSILEVTTRHEAIAHGLKFDMDKLDCMEEDVKKYISKLERDSFHDDTEHFVTVKLAEYNTAKVTECASEMLWEPSKRFIFKRNNIFEKSLEESSLGESNVIGRLVGDVVNILLGLDTNATDSPTRSLQSDLLEFGIRSKIIKANEFNSNVLTVCVVSNSSDLYGILFHLKRLNKLENCQILMVCLTSVRFKEPEQGYFGKLFGSGPRVKDQSYMRGYADNKCQRDKIPFVYIDTEDDVRKEKDTADAIQFISGVVRGTCV